MLQYILVGIWCLVSTSSVAQGDEAVLALTSTPQNAEVYVAGKLKVNTTPVMLRLAPDGHKIEIKHVRMAAQALDLVLAANESDTSDAAAQFARGEAYYNGTGVAQDYAEAVKWYRKAAEQGDAKAQRKLGFMYEYGRGVTEDDAEAVKWYRKAAEQGDAKAQRKLGFMYEYGRGVTEDDAEAWYRKAAEQGVAKVQLRLGSMYYYGIGVTQDYAEAVKWYRKAAEQDVASAQYNLGVMYGKGQGIAQDYAEAVKWYRKAAEQGDAYGQYNLGVMYANGLGVAKDATNASDLYQKAGNNGGVTIEPSMSISLVSNPDISYDGKWVTYTVDGDIWIVPTDGSKPPRKYAFGAKDESISRNSADGKYVAFLSDRGQDGKKQIYLLNTQGGEAEAITDIKEGVDDFSFFMNSETIYFLSTLANKDDPLIIDERYSYSRLFKLDLQTRKTIQLSKDQENVASAYSFLDDKKMAMIITPNALLEPQLKLTKLVIMNLSTMERNVILDNICSIMGWSLNGEQLWFLKPMGKNLSCQPASITLATGKVMQYGEKYQGSFGITTQSYDSKNFYMLNHEGIYGVINKFDTKTGNLTTLRKIGSSYDMTFSTNINGEWITFIDSTTTSPREVWVMKSDGSQAKKLTNHNSAAQAWKFGLAERIQWESKDHALIDGILVKPINYQPSQKYPLIVQVHGGPHSSWQLAWNDEAQLLANQGYAVLLPNPRGSLGYGREFVEANIKDWGGKDFEDIMSGVDYLIDKGIADPQRLGIGGHSYGGYMSAWAITQTTRFKAAVVGMGISNLVSVYGTADYHDNYDTFFENPPYRDFAMYQSHSPLTYVNKVQTPTLILHGELDLRVPVSQAYELYNGLKTIGVKTKLVVYPNEAHTSFASNHATDGKQRILDWYKTYLTP